MRFLIFIIFCQTVFAQIEQRDRFFITKGEQLIFYNGEKLTPVTTGATQLCFPFFLKGEDYYQINFAPVLSTRLIAQGVTKVFGNNYLIKDRLYSVVDGKGVFITSGVTDVYNSCPNPYQPRSYNHLMEQENL